MKRALLILLVTLGASGCLGAAEGPAPTPSASAPSSPPPPAAVDEAAAGPTPTVADEVLATSCSETEATFPSDPQDFDDGLPEGFRLVLDAQGRAIIAVLSHECRIGGQVAHAVLASVLLEVPSSLQRTGAAHGGLLSAWVDSPVILEALARWNVTTALERPVELESSGPGEFRESRTTMDEAPSVVDPDFVMTVTAKGSAVPTPYAALRIFEVLPERVVGGSFDVVHEPLAGHNGPATANFLYSPDPCMCDFPSHFVGEGWILEASDFAIRYAPAA